MNSSEAASPGGSSVSKTREDNQYLRITFEKDSGEGEHRGYNNCICRNKDDKDNFMFPSWVSETLVVALQRQFVAEMYFVLFCT